MSKNQTEAKKSYNRNFTMITRISKQDGVVKSLKSYAMYSDRDVQEHWGDTKMDDMESAATVTKHGA